MGWAVARFPLGKYGFWLMGLLLMHSICLAQSSPRERSLNRPSPERLGRWLVTALARADAHLLSQLLPTEQDLMGTVYESGMSGSDKGDAYADIPWILVQTDSVNRAAFANCFAGYPENPRPYRKARILRIENKELSGLETEFADVIVTYRVSKETYELRLNAVFLTPRGWVLGVEGFALKKVEGD